MHRLAMSIAAALSVAIVEIASPGHVVLGDDGDMKRQLLDRLFKQWQVQESEIATIHATMMEFDRDVVRPSNAEALAAFEQFRRELERLGDDCSDAELKAATEEFLASIHVKDVPWFYREVFVDGESQRNICFKNTGECYRDTVLHLGTSVDHRVTVRQVDIHRGQQQISYGINSLRHSPPPLPIWRVEALSDSTVTLIAQERGFVTRNTVRRSDGLVQSQTSNYHARIQHGFKDYNGIKLPRLSCHIRYRSATKLQVLAYLLTDAELNQPRDTNDFSVQIPSGTVIADRRSAKGRTSKWEGPLGDAISLADQLKAGIRPVPQE